MRPELRWVTGPMVGVLLVALMACSSASSPAAGSSPSSGGTTALGHKTIGLDYVIGSSPVSQRLGADLIRGAKLLGWDVKTCDGAGDTTKMAACEQSLVALGVDAIINESIEGSVVAAGIADAQAKHLPVINIGGKVTSTTLYDASYAPADTAASALITQYMMDRLEPAGGEIAMFVNDLNQNLKARGTIAKDIIALYPNVKIVATHPIDQKNLVADTQKAVTDILTAHPNLKAIWTVADVTLGATVRVIQAAGKSNQIFVTAWFANPDSVDLLRAGPPAGAVVHEWPEEDSWIALDQLAAFFAHGTAIDPLAGNAVSQPAQIIDQSNAPPSGQTPTCPFDYATYFTQKWVKAYGIKA
jgi:ABC-type sugar transport system substrate-binding protein